MCILPFCIELTSVTYRIPDAAPLKRVCTALKAEAYTLTFFHFSIGFTR